MPWESNTLTFRTAAPTDSTSLPWGFDGTTFGPAPTTPPTPVVTGIPNATSTPSKSGKVSVTTVAGAVVGAVLGLALLFLAVFLFLRRRRATPKKDVSHQPEPSRQHGVNIPLGAYNHEAAQSKSNISITSMQRHGGDDMGTWKQAEARDVV